VSAAKVLTVTFERNEQAYEAMTKLGELDSQHQIKLRAAAVVTRTASGQVLVEDKVGGPGYAGSGKGGILGLLIGIIGGPLGMLLGGVMGAAVGGITDLDDEEGESSVLAAISRRFHPGDDVLVAELEEQSQEVVDVAMQSLSGTVLRSSLIDVEGEMAYAQEVQREARRNARHKLHEERKRASEEQVKQKLAVLKAKLVRGRSESSADQASRPAAPDASQVSRGPEAPLASSGSSVRGAS